MLRDLQKPFFLNLFNVGLLALCVLPLLALALYNHPSAADDFCYIDTVFKYGYFKAMYYYFTGWTGRYSGIFLNHSNPLIIKWIGGFKMVSFLLIVALVYSIYKLIKQLILALPRLAAWGMVGCIFVLWLLKLPSLVGAFYWMAAFVTYTIPNILTIWWLIYMLRRYQEPATQKWSIGAALLVFLIIGFSETNLTLIVMLVGGWFGYQLVINRKLDWFALILVGVAGLGCLFFFSSAGNTQRISDNPLSGNIPFSAIEAIKRMIPLFQTWFFKTPLLVVTLLWITALPKILIDPNGKPNPYFSVPVWVVFLAVFGAMFVQLFPSYYGIGIEPVPRVFNSVYLWFLLGWFYGIGVFGNWIIKKDIFPARKWHFPPSIKAVFAALILISIFFSESFRMIYGDWLRGHAATYNKELYQRYELIKNAAPADSIVHVPRLSVYPQSIFEEDIKEDPNHWWCKCTGGYFGKKAVVLNP